MHRCDRYIDCGLISTEIARPDTVHPVTHTVHNLIKDKPRECIVLIDRQTGVKRNSCGLEEESEGAYDHRAEGVGRLDYGDGVWSQVLRFAETGKDSSVIPQNRISSVHDQA